MNKKKETINVDKLENSISSRNKESVDELVNGILNGNAVMLSKAITLIESIKESDEKMFEANEILKEIESLKEE